MDRLGPVLRKLAVTLLLATTTAGCDMVTGLLRGAGAPIDARVEVWNQTLDPILLIDSDGRRLDVPACGHAVAEQLNVREVRVRHEDGNIMGFGGGTGATQYIVLVADTSAISREEFPPVAIPPCQGHMLVQVGV